MPKAITPGILNALRETEAVLAALAAHGKGKEPEPDYDDTEGAEAYGSDLQAWETGRQVRPALNRIRRALRYAENS